MGQMTACGKKGVCLSAQVHRGWVTANCTGLSMIKSRQFTVWYTLKKGQPEGWRYLAGWSWACWIERFHCLGLKAKDRAASSHTSGHWGRRTTGSLKQQLTSAHDAWKQAATGYGQGWSTWLMEFIFYIHLTSYGKYLWNMITCRPKQELEKGVLYSVK